MERWRERLLSLALNRGALQFGQFTLASGQRSNYYFDGRLLTMDPEGALLIGRGLVALARRAGAHAIGGPTMGAVPIVGAVVALSGAEGYPLRGFFVRPQAKDHGTGRLVEGPLRPGDPVMVVDDVCTTGGSLLHAIGAVEGMGCRVVMVAVLLDRHQGGSQAIRDRGYPFTALLEATPGGQVRVAPG